MVYHYTLLSSVLCVIIFDYVNIMPIVEIIVIIAIIQFNHKSGCGFLCEHVMSKTNIRDGQHTEGIMLAKNPNGLITSVGH
jgi:hypothetical protein